ncbi:hypothetical protein BGZ74_005531, partial [Mortierella antarctica]
MSHPSDQYWYERSYSCGRSFPTTISTIFRTTTSTISTTTKMTPNPGMTTTTTITGIKKPS